MVVAQLVERLLPIPEVRNSNPVIGKIYIEHLFSVNCIKKTKIKKKRPRIAYFFLKKRESLRRRYAATSIVIYDYTWTNTE